MSRKLTTIEGIELWDRLEPRIGPWGHEDTNLKTEPSLSDSAFEKK